MRVFISHSKRNRQRAEQLARAIQQLNVEVWYDEWEVLVGQNLADQIYEGIKSSDYMLILLTRASVQSKWVKEEMDFAKASEIESRGTKIVPLLYENCDIPSALKAKAFADFRRSFEKGFSALSKLLVGSDVVASSPRVVDLRLDIELPLYSRRMVNNLFALGINDTEEIPAANAGEAGTAEQRLVEISELLSSFATRLEVDGRCYAWIGELVAMFQDAHVLQNWLEHRSYLFELWLKGTVLYSGGLAQKLSPNARIAFEVGRILKQLEDNREGWRDDFRLVYDELGFSERFFQLITSEDIPPKRITDALKFELRNLHDFRRIRLFHEKRIRAQGLEAGFQCIWSNTYLASPEQGVGAFTYLMCRSAEYVLAELCDFERAEYILEAAVKIFREQERRDEEKGVVEESQDDTSAETLYETFLETLLELYSELFFVARTWGQTTVAGKAFQLGFQIGFLLLLEADQVGLPYLHEIEALALQLGISEDSANRLRGTLTDFFYDEDLEPQRLFDMITELAESFRRHNPGVNSPVQ